MRRSGLLILTIEGNVTNEGNNPLQKQLALFY